VLYGIADSLSNLPTLDDKEDGDDEEDEEEDTELSKLSEDNEPGWVMDTPSETVQHHMEGLRQKQRRFDEVTQLGWGEAADYFSESDMTHGTTELNVLAVVKPQTAMTVLTPLHITFGELLRNL